VDQAIKVRHVCKRKKLQTKKDHQSSESVQFKNSIQVGGKLEEQEYIASYEKSENLK
jgi:hypothetical protein